MSRKEILDIVALVQNNPLTRLGDQDYQSKIITKIQNKFKDQDQQLFVANFYAYLNYDTRQDFVVNLDRVWKWIGYTRVDHCKTVLIKNFIENVDYRMDTPEKPAPEVAGAGRNLGGAGLNREFITLTVQCFKKLCLKSKTKKADEIHDYYLGLEEILNETVAEESQELRQRLQIEKQQVLEDVLVEQFPRNTQCIYFGTIDNLSTKKEKLVKFGHTNEIQERMQTHKKTYENFKLIKVYRVTNKLQIENAIKEHKILSKRIRFIIKPDGTQSREHLWYDEKFTLRDIDKYIKQIIDEHEYNAKKYEKLQEENEQLLEELTQLKREKHTLEEQNQKLLDKLHKYAPTLIKEVMTSEETKLINKNMSTNKAANGHYLYAWECKKMQYKIGICRIDGIETRENIYKVTDPKGHMSYKLKVENPWTEKLYIPGWLKNIVRF